MFRWRYPLFDLRRFRREGGARPAKTSLLSRDFIEMFVPEIRRATGALCRIFLEAIVLRGNSMSPSGMYVHRSLRQLCSSMVQHLAIIVVLLSSPTLVHHAF